MAIIKSGPASTAAGTNVAYTLNVLNVGPDDAATVSVSDPIPPDMTFVSVVSPAGWSCITPPVGGTGTVTCTNPLVPAGSNLNFTLTLAIPAGTAPGTFFTNVATVATATFDPTDENNSGTAGTIVSGGTSADVAVVKTAPPTVSAGSNIVYSIQAVNSGPDAAATVSLTDTLPGNLTFVSLSSPAGWACITPAVGGTGPITCTIASWAAASSGTFTLTANVPAGTPDGTTYDNFANVSSANDPTPENNTATAGTIVVAPGADVFVNKTAPATVVAGQNLTYTIQAGNNGPDAATNVSLSDTLAPGLTFVSLAAPGGWSCTTPAVGGTGTVTCTRPNLPVSTGTFTLTANVPAGTANGTVFNNTATIATSSTDINGGNNSSSANTTVIAAGVDLAIAKTHTSEPRAGQIGFTYTITVNNAGTGASTGTVTVTDILPPRLTATAMTGAGWSCSLGATPTCTRSDALAPGAAYPPITLTVNIAGDVAPTITNVATVSGGNDGNAANNTATDAATVRQRPDPTKDPDVVGLINSQIATAQRFASAQMSNFNERLEALRDDNTGDHFGLNFGGDDQDPCAVQGVNVPLDPFDPKCRRQLTDLPQGTTLGYAPDRSRMVSKAPHAPPRQTWRDYAFWSTGYVSFGSADQTAQRSGVEFNTSGVSAGIDYRLSRYLIAGIGVGYGRDQSKIGERGTRSDSDFFSVAGYGSFRPFKNVFLDGVLGYGALRFNSQRFVVDDGAFVYGSRDGHQFFASLTAAYEWRWAGTVLSPYGRINAAWLTLDAFTETSGLGGALTYSSQSAEFYTAVLGLRGKHTFLTDWGSFTPRFRVEYHHDFAGSSTVFLHYADLFGPIYTLTTTPAERDRMSFGAGADFMLWNVHRVAFDYSHDTDFLAASWHRFRVRWDARF